MRTGELHSSDDHRRGFHIINYDDLPVGRERKKTQEPDRYVAELRAIRRQQRLFALLLLLAIIACCVIGGAWILSKRSAPELPATPAGISFTR